LHGEFVINNRYGEQFAVSKVETALPVSREGIIRYLSSGLFKGIGPVTALRIVEVFGTDALVVMSTDPLKLKQVKGISKKRAIEIAESFNSMTAMQDTILFLQS
jgi:exodeoxyribonuclease V alpha subunit